MHTTTANTRHAFAATTGSLVCATCGMTRGSVRHSYLGSNRHITKENPMFGTTATATDQPRCMVCGNGMYINHGETLPSAQRAVVSLWVADATHPEQGRLEAFPVHAFCLHYVVVYRDQDPEAFDQQRAR